MKKSIILAILITFIVLALAYLGYIPSYICVTISICTFIIAISSSICYEIRDSINNIITKSTNASQDNSVKIANEIESLKEVLNENKSSIGQSFENLNKSLENKLNELYDCTNSIVTQLEKVYTVLEKSHKTQENLSTLASNSYADFSNTLNQQFDKLNNNNNSVKNAIIANTSLLEKLNTAILPLEKVINDCSESIKTTTSQNAQQFNNAIDSLTTNLREQICDVVTKLNNLKESIGAYTETSISLKESNSVLATNVTNAVNTINDTVSSTKLNNQRLIDEFKDATTDSIDDLLRGINKTTTDQSQSLSEGEEKIRDSVNKLCSNLTSCLNKIDYEVSIVCESVEEMKKMSQVVEQSDKILLSQISKMCK